MLIINDSKENFMFKNFKELSHITEDLAELNTHNVYEDISLEINVKAH